MKYAPISCVTVMGQAVTATDFCKLTATLSEITVDRQTGTNKIMNININYAGMW